MHSFIARQLHVIHPLILVQSKMKVAWYRATIISKKLVEIYSLYMDSKIIYTTLRKKKEPKWLSWRVILKFGSLLWKRAPKWSSKESWVTDNQMTLLGEPFWLSFFSQWMPQVSHFRNREVHLVVIYMWIYPEKSKEMVHSGNKKVEWTKRIPIQRAAK